MPYTGIVILYIELQWALKLNVNLNSKNKCSILRVIIPQLDVLLEWGRKASAFTCRRFDDDSSLQPSNTCN